MPEVNYYDDNNTIQWINEVKYMTSSPHPNHSRVYLEILTSISTYLRGKSCKVFPDKLDLCLADPKETINISDLRKPIVPNLIIVCYDGNESLLLADFYNFEVYSIVEEELSKCFGRYDIEFITKNIKNNEKCTIFNFMKKKLMSKFMK